MLLHIVLVRKIELPVSDWTKKFVNNGVTKGLSQEGGTSLKISYTFCQFLVQKKKGLL